MGTPYRARVNERRFLNLPGFHGGAYVVAYVEDTTGCAPRVGRYCEEGCDHCPENFEPRMILEIADCQDRINLEFDIDTEAARANSLHKLDTLISALRVFRAGVHARLPLLGEADRPTPVDAIDGSDVIGGKGCRSPFRAGE